MVNGFTRDVPITLSADTIKPTHADHIRSMSDEEMASQLCDLAYDRWYNGVFDDGDEGERLLDWLRQPAEEENP